MRSLLLTATALVLAGPVAADWQYTESVDVFDDSKTATLTLNASEIISGDNPITSIQYTCSTKDNTSNMIAVTKDTLLGTHATVKFRFDSDPAAIMSMAVVGQNKLLMEHDQAIWSDSFEETLFVFKKRTDAEDEAAAQRWDAWVNGEIDNWPDIDIIEANPALQSLVLGIQQNDTVSISRFNLLVAKHEKLNYIWRGCRSTEEFLKDMIIDKEHRKFGTAESLYMDTILLYYSIIDEIEMETLPSGLQSILHQEEIDNLIIAFNTAVEDYVEYAVRMQYGEHTGVDFRVDDLDTLKEMIQQKQDEITKRIEDARKRIEDARKKQDEITKLEREQQKGIEETLKAVVDKCWVVDIGSPAANVTVVLGMQMTPEGKVKPGSMRLVSAQGGADSAAKTAYQAARRAVLRCQKGGYNLPTEKYEHWREIELTFNPEHLR